MSHYLIEQLARDRQHRGATRAPSIDEMHGDGHLEGLTLATHRHRRGASASTRPGCSSSSAAQPRTDWLDGVVARDARGFVLTGPDLLVDGQRPRGWPLERDPYHLEASSPGRVRRRRRAGRLGQAGRVGRRRGRDGRHPGAPLPGNAMTLSSAPTDERLVPRRAADACSSSRRSTTSSSTGSPSTAGSSEVAGRGRLRRGRPGRPASTCCWPARSR